MRGIEKEQASAWCFDCLMLDGKDLRKRPLLQRRAILREAIAAEADVLRFSDSFEDPYALLAAADDMQLEGIVSKRALDPYLSGLSSGWVKTKTASWREENRKRWKLFEKMRRR